MSACDVTHVPNNVQRLCIEQFLDLQTYVQNVSGPSSSCTETLPDLQARLLYARFILPLPYQHLDTSLTILPQPDWLAPFAHQR